MDQGRYLFFNVQHAPVGAFSSFTLGAKGASGGLGLELGGPANEDVYVGAESANAPGMYQALPFFSEIPQGMDSQDFDVESLSGIRRSTRLKAYPDGDIHRTFGAGVDAWTANDLQFRVFFPAKSVPDPAEGMPDELRHALAPSVLCELTLDNTSCGHSRKVFFGYSGSDRTSAMRTWRHGHLRVIGQAHTAIATDDPGVYGGTAFQPEAILHPTSEANLKFMLGKVGLLVGEVPAGQRRTFTFAVAFFKSGRVTSGLPSHYLYTKYFGSIEEVLGYTISSAAQIKAEAEEQAREINQSLQPARARMLSQAIGSYYGSTQCLELENGEPLWIVNEGEYRMMNTLDLMADQAFFELLKNPWTVRNEIEFHAGRHSYVDRVRQPGRLEMLPGGIAFAHDVGVANAFAEPGRSAYEQAGLTGCFSYMSSEELVNWVLCACLYGLHSGGYSWLTKKEPILLQCLESLLNRDHPDDDQRNGLMGLDSDRCEKGAEITTYDSLDASLGRARGNLYLGVKAWAAYVLLDAAFSRIHASEPARLARTQAERAATTICAAAGPDGILPALLESDVDARILPVVEGLAFPSFLGFHEVLREDGRYGSLITVLKRHFARLYRSSDCRFADGGVRLSSSSRNSWLSKIYLCQYVAEAVFGLPADREADEAHLGWLMQADNAYFAWSDQMLEGSAVGSRYYPRGVTGILWLSGAKAKSEPSERKLTEVSN